MSDLLDALNRQAGLTGRYLASGALALPATLANPLAWAANQGLGAIGSDYRFPDQYEALQRAMTEAGLPQPQSGPEKVAGFFAEMGVPDPSDFMKAAALAPALAKMSDLPMDEASRMARAKEMGFDTTAYHGTDADIQAFDKAKRGGATKARTAKRATWFVDDPEVAEGYANYAAKDAPVQKLIDESYALERRGKWDDASSRMADAENLENDIFKNPERGQNIMPVKLKGKNFYEVDAGGSTWGDLGDNQVNEWLDEAQAGGYEGLKITDLVDNADWGSGKAATHYAVFEPKDIRSTNAAFDPAKKDSANILAAHPAATVLGGSLAAALLAQMYPQDRP